LRAGKTAGRLMFGWQQGVKRTQWCLHATDDQMGGAFLMCNGVYRVMKRVKFKMNPA
jgi:hypothetical protein